MRRAGATPAVHRPGSSNTAHREGGTPMTDLGSAPAIDSDVVGEAGSRSPQPGRPWADSLRSAASHVRASWMLLGVLAAYIVGAFVVPTLAPVSISDDPMYARSVEILLRDHRLVLMPVIVPTQVFLIGWGALFGAIFNDSLGVFRVSVVVLMWASGIAFYALCLELGVSRARSALGTAVYLFCPLSYVLGFTFMTDPLPVALLVISLACYVRALRGGEVDGRWLVAGSVVTALGFLVRQNAFITTVGVVTMLFVARRITRDRAGLRVLLQAALVPVVAVVAYYVWFKYLYGGPKSYGQDNFTHDLFAAGPVSTLSVAGSLLTYGLFYVGFFAFPVAIVLVGRAIGMVRKTRRSVLLGVAAWLGVMVVGMGVLSASGRHVRWPQFAQFVTLQGLGPADLRGGRLPLVGAKGALVLTVVFGITSLVWAFFVFRKAGTLLKPAQWGAALIVAVLVWQFLGVIPTSVYLHDAGISYDRYLAPLVPLVIVLALWSVRDVRFSLPAAWVVTGVVAVASVMGTHDYLTFQRTAWKVANDAHTSGIAYRRIDGGAAWDAYHLFEYSRAHHAKVTLADLAPLKALKNFRFSPHDESAWWIPFYAPADTQEYVVSSEKLKTYKVLRQVEYSQWLVSEDTHIYLLKRP
jgi:hypothetical protein